MPPIKKLTRSQITTLTTGLNGIGSFVGQRLQSLQQANLEPGEYTIQFQIVEPPIDGAGSATYAYVSWKVDGQQIQRIISVFSGASISGVAESAHVQLLDQSGRGAFVQGSGFGLPSSVNFTVTNGSDVVTASIPMTFSADEVLFFQNQPTVPYPLLNGVSNSLSFRLATPFTGPNGVTRAIGITSYKIGVSLSKGTRPTTMQPATLLTVRPQFLAPNNSVNIPIPQDAGVISSLITVTLGPIPGVGADPENVQVAFVAADGFNLTGYIPAEFGAWYPVPPGAVTLGIWNPPGNTQQVFVSVQWGIEG